MAYPTPDSYTGAGTIAGPPASTADLWDFFGEMLYSNILEPYYPKLLLGELAQHVRIPGHRGKKAHVRQWNKVNPVVEMTVLPTQFDKDGGTGGTLLDEFEGPALEGMTLKEFSATIRGFAGGFLFTDIHMAISEVVETLAEGSQQLGAGYAEKMEDERLKTLLDAADSADANQQAIELGSGGKAWGSVTATDYMLISDLFRVGTEFESVIDGITYRYPDGYWRGVIHPRAKQDLFTFISSTQPDLVDWTNTTRGQGMFEKGRVPVINDVAIETSAFSTTNPFSSHAAFAGSSWPSEMDTAGLAAGVSGYISWFFGPGAFANLDLANATPSLIIQPFGSSGAINDPFKRAMSVGVKGYEAFLALDMARRCIMMATATSTTV